jgi:hypothetical protein
MDRACANKDCSTVLTDDRTYCSKDCRMAGMRQAKAAKAQKDWPDADMTITTEYVPPAKDVATLQEELRQLVSEGIEDAKYEVKGALLIPPAPKHDWRRPPEAMEAIRSWTRGRA